MVYRSSGSGQQLGYLGGVRWKRGDYLVKASYEYATRLPDEQEIFGDGRLTKENMDLKHEHRDNINMNGRYRVENGDESLELSVGYFYGRVSDIVLLQPYIHITSFINYDKAEVKDFEVKTVYTAGRH